MTGRGGIMCSAIGVAVLATPAQALEPLSPAGSYGNVCAALQRVANAADALAGSDAHENLTAYTNALIGLGFSAETRLTVDADDLDPLFTAGEVVGYQGAEGLTNAIKEFAGRYRCRVVE